MTRGLPGPRRSMILLLALTLALGCSPSTPAAGGTDASGTGDATYANATVVDVVDGDTIDVRIGRRRARVRLIGINTPETVDPRRPPECYGTEASALTHRLLPTGTAIRLERDGEARDDYDRLLAYVFRASDRLFVNLELVRRGAALPLRIEPNTSHAAEIAQAAFAAERSGAGLWSRCPR